jgi:hypothetical protein
MIKITNTTNYIRPKTTLQEKLTSDEIEQKLEDYTEVDNINKIPIKSHLRYYTLKRDDKGNMSKVFRLGGNLINKDNSDKYIILSNGKVSWSVQTKNTIFYRKMKINEIKDEYETIIEELKDEIMKLKKDNKKYIKHILELKKNK